MHHARPETLVFAYGSNLDPVRMQGRIPSARPVGPAFLAAHRLRFHLRGTIDGTAKADAVPTGNPGDHLPGVVYALAPGALPVLDRIESGYRRLRHWLPLPGRVRGGRFGDLALRTPSRCPVWSYHGDAEVVDPGLLPAPWYLEHVRRGARFHGLPARHQAALEVHPVLPDAVDEAAA